MGKASKGKWKQKFQVPRPSPQSWPTNSQSPWYESNLLWSGVGTCIAIILTVLAAMKGDLRWLLWFAWAAAFCPIWIIFKNFGIRKVFQIAVFLVGVSLSGWGFYELHRLLDPGQTEPPGKSSSPLVSINCSPDSLPIPGKHPESLFAVYLHPKWGDDLVKFLYGTVPEAVYWPDRKTFGIVYSCQVTNMSNVKFASISLLLRVDFRSEARGQKSRTFELGLPIDLDPQQRFIFHIADDSGWDPVVTLPEFVRVRLNGERKSIAVPVEYATRNGEPMHLAGFVSH
jgi:hypothetical protein